MPPKQKEGSKKKSSKKVEQIAALNGLISTYKGACVHHSTTPLKPILQELEGCIEKGKVLEKFTLQGPDIAALAIKAVLDCCAFYPYVKNLSFWGCLLGDEGLTAVARFITSSAAPRWPGSKIRCLEITSDGLGYPADLWAQRYMSMIKGDTGMVAIGQSMRMPSLLLEEKPLVENVGDAKERGQARQQATFTECSLRTFALAIGTFNVTLATLVLDHCALHDSGMAILCDGLRRCTNIKQLSVAYCSFQSQGAYALASTLLDDDVQMAHILPKFETINMQGNHIGGQGVYYISHALGHHQFLKAINMSDVGLTDADIGAVSALAHAIDAAASLMQIDLSSNAIGDEGVTVLLSVLGECQHVKQLRVSSIRNRELGKSLFEAILSHTPLKGGKKKGKSAAG